jgi:hypothetical protein
MPITTSCFVFIIAFIIPPNFSCFSFLVDLVVVRIYRMRGGKENAKEATGGSQVERE